MKPFSIATALFLAGISIVASSRSLAVVAPTPPRWYLFEPGQGLSSYYSIVKTKNDDIWVADNSSGNLYRFSPDGGHVRTFPLAPFHPEMMIVGPGGDFYINSLASGAIAIVSQSGKIRTYPLPSGDYAFGGLAVGTDGNVWFVEESHVGRITPRGVITLYPYIPYTLSRVGITSGPDGKLWFVGNHHQSIVGNIDPATKKFTTYDLRRAEWCYPVTIVAGPDGNLWFTCQRDGIGLITTSGKYTMFKMPGFGFAGPQSVAVGPDGALWFSAGKSGPNATICRFDVHTHRLNTWVSPSNIIWPWAITLDTEGNVWGANQSSQVLVFVPRSL
jgi:virginiamycin B lyase